MGAAWLRPIPVSRQRSRSGKWSGSTISSPRTQGWPKLGRGNRRRRRTARTGGSGRGGRCCWWGSLLACPQAKATAHVRARGCVGCVTRWRNAWEEWELAQAAVVATAMAMVARARVKRGLKKGRARPVMTTAWPWICGRGTAAWTDARTAGRRGQIGGPWRAPHRFGADNRWHVAWEDSKEPRGTGAWGRRGFGWRVASSGAALARTSWRGPASAISFRCAPVWIWITTNFWIEVHQALNTKVVDLTTLYTFTRAIWCSAQQFWHNKHQSLNAIPCQGIGGATSWPRFPLFSTQNWKCQSTWKLCPSTIWTTFIKVDF
jgi:hypothetical protein